MGHDGIEGMCGQGGVLDFLTRFTLLAKLWPAHNPTHATPYNIYYAMLYFYSGM